MPRKRAIPVTEEWIADQEIAQRFVPPTLGEYRCYWANEWNRPCNKFLGMGSGPFARRCPRCKHLCAFEAPNVGV